MTLADDSCTASLAALIAATIFISQCALTSHSWIAKVDWGVWKVSIQNERAGMADRLSRMPQLGRELEWNRLKTLF